MIGAGSMVFCKAIHATPSVVVSVDVKHAEVPLDPALAVAN